MPPPWPDELVLVFGTGNRCPIAPMPLGLAGSPPMPLTLALPRTLALSAHPASVSGRQSPSAESELLGGRGVGSVMPGTTRLSGHRCGLTRWRKGWMQIHHRTLTTQQPRPTPAILWQRVGLYVSSWCIQGCAMCSPFGSMSLTGKFHEEIGALSSTYCVITVGEGWALPHFFGDHTSFNFFSFCVPPPLPRASRVPGKERRELAEGCMASAPGFWFSWSLASSPSRHGGLRGGNLMLHMFDFLVGGAHGGLGEVLSHDWGLAC